MLGKMSQKVFVQVYVMLLLNLYFWAFTLIGGVVLGVGPALRAITELYLDSQSDYQNVKFRKGWAYFKKYFKIANGQFYLFAGIEAVLIFNLVLSTELHGLWVLMIQFILIFAIAAGIVLGGNTLLLVSKFAVDTKNALKLAFGQFLSNFPKFLVTLAGLAGILVASFLWKGLIIFLTVSVMIKWFNHCGQPWYARVDKMLAAA
ncbi:YesL family protein [Schleiferilactobacillus shenzhenensis]|uniref:YesL family protein n=1 Tax=Schleiferilactobacillus shenzhenensis TaxID=1231337 RepID=UPI0003F5B4AD|nr:DUF624 domain-containing protein [Schleiferilactobacillus shenzhenensis]